MITELYVLIVKNSSNQENGEPQRYLKPFTSIDKINDKSIYNLSSSLHRDIKHGAHPTRR